MATLTPRTEYSAEETVISFNATYFTDAVEKQFMKTKLEESKTAVIYAAIDYRVPFSFDGKTFAFNENDKIVILRALKNSIKWN